MVTIMVTIIVTMVTIMVTMVTIMVTMLYLQREFYKQKVKTLTEQLLEKNECQPIAQVEQLLVENRELRDKVHTCFISFRCILIYFKRKSVHLC